jgi:hypothetical protein
VSTETPREQFIRGLRDLADLIERCLDMPGPSEAVQITVHPVAYGQVADLAALFDLAEHFDMPVERYVASDRECFEAKMHLSPMLTYTLYGNRKIPDTLPTRRTVVTRDVLGPSAGREAAAILLEAAGSGCSCGCEAHAGGCICSVTDHTLTGPCCEWNDVRCRTCRAADDAAESLEAAGIGSDGQS